MTPDDVAERKSIEAAKFYVRKNKKRHPEKIKAARKARKKNR